MEALVRWLQDILNPLQLWSKLGGHFKGIFKLYEKFIFNKLFAKGFKWLLDK